MTFGNGNWSNSEEAISVADCKCRIQIQPRSYMNIQDYLMHAMNMNFFFDAYCEVAVLEHDLLL